MGKKKFIKKQQSTVVKMVYRPTDHLQTNEDNTNLRVFQVVKLPVNNTQGEEQQKNLAEIIEKKLNDGDYTTNNYKKKQIEEYDDHGEYPSLPEHIKKQLDSRDDLWINQLQKIKQSQQQKGSEEFNQFESDQQKKLILNPNIKMKEFDENCLPIDGYDYYQHVADKIEGDVLVSYTVKDEERPQIMVDIDYQVEEMTEEQKEVFEALQYEGEEPIYEELEDNFIELANGGEDCYIQTDKQPLQQFEKIYQNEDKQLEKIEIKESNKQKDKKSKEISDSENEEDYEDIEENDYDEDDEEQYDSDDQLDVNSDVEKEFEKEMKNYDDEGQKNQKKQVTFSDQQLNKILDDHILFLNKQKAPIIKNEEEEKKKNKEREDEERERELLALKKKDYLAYLMKKYPNTPPEDFVLPKVIPQLSMEEDIALQNYLKQVNEEEENDQVVELQEEEVEKEEYENILQRQLHESTMSKLSPDQVNIVRWSSNNKSKKKKEEEKDKENNLKKDVRKQLEQEREKDHQIYIEKLQQLTVSKNETKEQKQERKKLIKQLKKEKQSKKKAFKNAFVNEEKGQAQKEMINRENTNIQGISVVKID